jgi:D-glycero-alpha-D-manno-heptose-7-phosphate kinase
MMVRCKAPLRIGLAGGGTDVSPYTDQFGGAILNATVSLFAYAFLKVRTDQNVILKAMDRHEELTLEVSSVLPLDGKLDLAKGVFNRLVKDFNIPVKGFELTTYVDAPPGSGLGSSSTLVVAILGAFVEAFKLPLGEYDIAHLAYSIEREDLEMAGGRQDQYAATFGGFNFMEFGANDKVIVNPLRIKEKVLFELENNLVLFFTETSRLSSSIIQKQQDNVNNNVVSSIDAMHHLKEQAILMKEALLKGEVNQVGEILHFGWQQKKAMAQGITNDSIDHYYETAMNAGATGGKISGAGGGGFMIFYAPENHKFQVINSLESIGGKVLPYQFVQYGMVSWGL